MMDQLSLSNTTFGPDISANPRGGTLVAGNILSGNVCPQLGVMPWAESGGLAGQDRLELFPELTNEHLAGAMGARGLEHAAIRIPGQSRPVRSVIEDITEFPLAELPVDYPGLRHVLHFDRAPEHDGEFIRIRYKVATNIIGLTPAKQSLAAAQAVSPDAGLAAHMDGGLCFYHPWKRDNIVGVRSAETGKIADVPRPYLQNLDAAGGVISHHWGEWDLSEWESDKVLVKVIPASAIDAAAASWAIDATLGYTSEPVNVSNINRYNAQRWNAQLVGPGGDVTLQSMTYWTGANAANFDFRCALYGGDTVRNFIAATDTANIGAISSKTAVTTLFPAATDVTLSANAEYSVVGNINSPGAVEGWWDAGITGAKAWRSDIAWTSEWLAPHTPIGLNYDDLLWGLYMTYETVGGTPALPFSRNRYGELSGYSRGRFGGS